MTKNDVSASEQLESRAGRKIGRQWTGAGNGDEDFRALLQRVHAGRAGVARQDVVTGLKLTAAIEYSDHAGEDQTLATATGRFERSPRVDTKTMGRGDQ